MVEGGRARLEGGRARLEGGRAKVEGGRARVQKDLARGKRGLVTVAGEQLARLRRRVLDTWGAYTRVHLRGWSF